MNGPQGSQFRSKRKKRNRGSRAIHIPSAQWIREHVFTPSIRLSNSFFWDVLELRKIEIKEIDEALQSCEIIEIQRNHNPVRILVNGYTHKKRPLHVVFSVWPIYHEGDFSMSCWLDVVTAYEPDPSEWLNPIKRKPKD